MPNMDVWDWVMLALGAYVAITSLVILMRRRRDEMLAEMAKDAEAARERQRQEDLREAKKQPHLKFNQLSLTDFFIH